MKIKKIFSIIAICLIVFSMFPFSIINAEQKKDPRDVFADYKTALFSGYEGLSETLFDELNVFLAFLAAKHFLRDNDDNCEMDMSGFLSGDLNLSKDAGNLAVSIPDWVAYNTSSNTYAIREKYIKNPPSDEEVLKVLVVLLKQVGNRLENENSVVKQAKQALDELPAEAETSKYYQMILEECAIETLYNLVDKYKQALLDNYRGSCDMYNEFKNNFKVIDENGNYSNHETSCMNCEDVEKIYSTAESKLKTEKSNYVTKEKEIEPKVLDIVKQAAGIIKTANTNVNNKANAVWDNLTFSGASRANGDPEFDLAKLITRAKDAAAVDGNTGISGLEKDFSQLVDLIGKIGRYIMYALILFFGVKTIWTGIEGRAQFKELLPYLALGIIFFWAAGGIKDMIINVLDLSSASTGEEPVKAVFSAIVYVVRIAAFAGIIFTGIKLAFSGPEKKAEMKSHLLPVLIGSILVFGASTVVGFILNSANDAGLKTDNKKSMIIQQYEIIEKYKA